MRSPGLSKKPGFLVGDNPHPPPSKVILFRFAILEYHPFTAEGRSCSIANRLSGKKGRVHCAHHCSAACGIGLRRGSRRRRTPHSLCSSSGRGWSRRHYLRRTRARRGPAPRIPRSAAVVSLSLQANGLTLIRVSDPLTAFVTIACHLRDRVEPPRHGIRSAGQHSPHGRDRSRCQCLSLRHGRRGDRNRGPLSPPQWRGHRSLLPAGGRRRAVSARGPVRRHHPGSSCDRPCQRGSRG